MEDTENQQFNENMVLSSERNDNDENYVVNDETKSVENGQNLNSSSWSEGLSGMDEICAMITKNLQVEDLKGISTLENLKTFNYINYKYDNKEKELLPLDGDHHQFGICLPNFKHFSLTREKLYLVRMNHETGQAFYHPIEVNDNQNVHFNFIPNDVNLNNKMRNAFEVAKKNRSNNSDTDATSNEKTDLTFELLTDIEHVKNSVNELSEAEERKIREIRDLSFTFEHPNINTQDQKFKSVVKILILNMGAGVLVDAIKFSLIRGDIEKSRVLLTFNTKEDKERFSKLFYSQKYYYRGILKEYLTPLVKVLLNRMVDEKRNGKIFSVTTLNQSVHIKFSKYDETFVKINNFQEYLYHRGKLNFKNNDY